MRKFLLSLFAIAFTFIISLDTATAGYRGGHGGFVAAGPHGGVVAGRGYRGGAYGGYHGGRQFYGNNGGGNWGPAAGIGVGLGVLGIAAAIANSGNYNNGGYSVYDDGYGAAPVCYITRRRVVDAWGNLIAVRRVRVCD